MTPLLAQHELADSLLFYEKTYFKNSDTVAREDLLVKKLGLYLRNGITNGDAFHEVKRVRINYLQHNKSDFLWDAAILAYLNHENDRAAFYLSEYSVQNGDSTTTTCFLSFMINKYNDTAAANKTLNMLCRRDSSFNSLRCFSNIAGYERRHLNFYLIASAVLPGSGTMMNGSVVKGVVSFALAAGSVYGIVQLVQYGLYINAVLWGSGIGLKFYTGNLRLTERTFYQREEQKKNRLAKDCESEVKKLMERYPLTLKAL